MTTIAYQNQLAQSDLFQQRAYINGIWTAADNGKVIEVFNPASNDCIGNIPDMSVSEAEKAIQAAHTAFLPWKQRSAHDRATILHRWHQLMLAHAEDLAFLMTIEQGKPLAEALGEVKYAASFIAWFAEEAKRLYGDVIPSPNTSQRLLVIKEPIGVCTAITPWNFPLAMITRKAAPALAAGCTMVLKPANETPFSALAMAKLAEMAGIPAGVLNVITGDSAKLGMVMSTHPLVNKLTFTGSTRVGRLLMKQCSDTIKKVSLELGGNAPFIVFDDADIDKAVEGAMVAKYRNAGQTCVCANRIFVQKGVYEEFAEKFAEKVKNLVVGSGLEENVQIGPLINDNAVRKINSLVADATQKGAKILVGGRPHERGGNFFEPTVITDIQSNMELFSEEIFGPVAPLIVFESEDEVINAANDSIYGLAAYMYSENLSRVWRIAERLETGMVGINTGIISSEVVPFGGVKQSGIGREGSKYGIEDFIETKYLCMSI